MLTEYMFIELVTAASLAPSADNMQPWEFRKNQNNIEVFYAKNRLLPTDVNNMFTWISIGAAIQNIVIKSNSLGYNAIVEYSHLILDTKPIANISFLERDDNNNLVNFIPLRNTNRNNYEEIPLEDTVISKLTQSVNEFGSGVYWTNSKQNLDLLAKMDANSSYIRIEHKPLHDELFDILRFTKEEIESTRYGLTFESLDIPSFAVFFARNLKYWSITFAISQIGLSRLVAKKLSNKIRKSGALCLITAIQSNVIEYIKAGRTMQQLWLSATEEGLSVQPYGVLPQYLTKVEVEPKTFLPKYIKRIKKQKSLFFKIFPEAKLEHPAIILRIGRTEKNCLRSDLRLEIENIIRE